MHDTTLCGPADMIIAEYYKPDPVLAPIGGNFTMAPGTIAEFRAAMAGSDIRIIGVTEGQTAEF